MTETKKPKRPKKPPVPKEHPVFLRIGNGFLQKDGSIHVELDERFGRLRITHLTVDREGEEDAVPF